VRTVLYTEKTVAQSLSALTERLHASGKRLDGWVEKNGNFSLSLSSPVIGKISRRTHIHGKLERTGGITTVTLDVPSGADPRGQLMIFIALAMIAIILLASGNLVPALLLVGAGAALYIPLAGDHRNSPLLISEVQRALKATAKPPKKPTEPAAGRAPSARPPAPKTSAPVRKPGDF
jgi:hypothetical protein